MKKQNFAFLLVLGAISLFKVEAQASYDFGSSSYEEMSDSLSVAIGTPADKISQQTIHQINHQFAGLPRSTAPVNDLREVKFKILYWRLQTAKKILHALKTEQTVEGFSRRINELRELRLLLNDGDIDLLIDLPLAKSDLAAKSALMTLLADQGQGQRLDELFKNTNKSQAEKFLSSVAGPRADVAIFPLVPSKFPFEKWSEDPEFSNYAYPDPASPYTIQYRGLTLKAGDFMLVNSNDPTDGDFTSLGVDRAYVSHFVMLAILEKDGRRFPVGVEIHTDGLRAMPLSRFLSRNVVSYIEFYRLRGMDEAWRNKINSVVRDELKKPHGYDFQSQDSDRRYIHCATTLSLFLEESGVKPIEGNTVVRESIRDDFAQLGLNYHQLLTPTDISRSPRIDFVGTLDQNLYGELLAKDLTAGQLSRIFDEGTVDFKRAPLSFYFYRWAVGQVKNGTKFGNLVLKIKHMDPANFPNAPAQLLGWVTPFENRYRKMVTKSLPLLEERIMQLEPSLHEIEKDPEVLKLLESHSKKVKKLFSEADSLK